MKVNNALKITLLAILTGCTPPVEDSMKSQRDLLIRSTHMLCLDGVAYYVILPASNKMAIAAKFDTSGEIVLCEEVATDE